MLDIDINTNITGIVFRQVSLTVFTQLNCNPLLKFINLECVAELGFLAFAKICKLAVILPRDFNWNVKAFPERYTYAYKTRDFGVAVLIKTDDCILKIRFPLKFSELNLTGLE